MKNKDIFFSLRRLHGYIHETIQRCKSNIRMACYLIFPLGKKVLIPGTPEHQNLGDSAIAIAQMHFLEQCGISPDRIKEITFFEYRRYAKLLRKLVNRNYLVTQLGGGNLGDQWLPEEQLHRDSLTDFPNSKVIIFPQTIYYTDAPLGQSEQQKSVSIYNGRKNLTMVAREQTSYEIMQKLYPATPVLLTPDIVLSADASVFGVHRQKRKGVLLCFRSDAEQAMTAQERQEIENFLQNERCTCHITDMYADGPVTKENRWEYVQKKINEFAAAKLVITDRLHGMLFAALAQTPCIAFSNYNQKVEGTYEWIKYLPYIRFVKSVEEAERAFVEFKEIKNCKFDNAPLASYFEKLAEVVKKYAAN